jgi:predicted HTH transcriptional regulator
MIIAMRELRLEPPIFENKRGNFNVIFKNHTLMTKEDRKWLNQIGEEISENEAYALIYLKNNEIITNGDYQKINNINRDKALQELRGLIRKNLIEVHGVGSGSYYKLTNSVRDTSEEVKNNINIIDDEDKKGRLKNNFKSEDQDIYRNLDFNDTEKKIIGILLEGEISKRELVNRLGYKTLTGNIKRAIDDLISKNIIKYTIVDKPTSKYQKIAINR